MSTLLEQSLEKSLAELFKTYLNWERGFLSSCEGKFVNQNDLREVLKDSHYPERIQDYFVREFNNRQEDIDVDEEDPQNVLERTLHSSDFEEEDVLERTLHSSDFEEEEEGVSQEEPEPEPVSSPEQEPEPEPEPEPEQEEEEEEDDEDEELLLTRRRKRKRGSSSRRKEGEEEMTMSQETVLSTSSLSNSEKQYYLYLTWYLSKYYCKIGITSSNHDEFLKRYRTYIGNFYYWIFPLKRKCIWNVARQYETLVHNTLQQYQYYPTPEEIDLETRNQLSSPFWCQWSGPRGNKQEFYQM